MSAAVGAPTGNAPEITRSPVVISPKRELHALTGLRFFAAFSVVIYHFGQPLFAGAAAPIRSLAGTGYIAVSLFFLLSGFVLSYSYLNRQGDMRGSRRGFWAARFARIYPAYLLAFLLAAPTNLLWTLHVNHGAAGALKLVTGGSAVLGLVQAWTPWTAWYWNYPAWSVSVEAFFYLSFPFLAPLVGRVQKKSTCVLAMFGLWIIALAAPVALYLARHITTAPGLNDHLQMAVEFTPLLRLPEFLIGVLLSRFFVLGFAIRPGLSRGLSYASAALVVAVLCFSAGIPHPILANGLLAPLFAVLILSLAYGEGLLAKFLSVGYVV